MDENDNGTITNCYYDSTIYTGNAIGDDSGNNYKSRRQNDR